MGDDAAPGLDPALRQRWAAVRRKMEENAGPLLTQGGLVPKVTSSGRRAWAVRWVDRSGDRPVHRSVFVGDDGRLVDLVRRQLAEYRALGGLPGEVAGYARFAASASFAVRRPGAVDRRGRPRA